MSFQCITTSDDLQLGSLRRVVSDRWRAQTQIIYRLLSLKYFSAFSSNKSIKCVSTEAAGETHELFVSIRWTHPAPVQSTNQRIFSCHRSLLSVVGSVCISIPLWQIRIFGLFFSRQIRISGFYPDFLCRSVGPYILFSNCMWRRRCRPTDENKNAVMSKLLRDGVMCFRLKIHSRWMMKTHWRAGSWSWSWSWSWLGLLLE